MRGFDRAWEPEDYADAELVALREQEARLEREIREGRARALCEQEKEGRRKRIRELGGKPVA